MENTFTVEQKPFLSLLSAMQPICTKRTTLDATSYVMVSVGHKELVLKSTDLEISLQASHPLKDTNAFTAQPFLVSGKRLFDIVRELDGIITFTIKGNQLMLQAGSVHLSLNIRDTQDFPPFPERIENLMDLDAKLLLAMLGKVSFLIPQNSANPALNGLYLEITDSALTMTTTDGHSLAQAGSTRYHLSEARKWLIPRRAVFEVRKLLENAQDATLFLGLCGNQLVFSGESFNFFTKLLADPFPEYKQILERKDFCGAVVDRVELVKTLRRSSCLLSGQFIATNFGFAGRTLNVSMENNEVGALKEKLSLVDFNGDNVDIRFYAPYLLGGLQVFADDKVKFSLKNASKPIIFESEQDDIRMMYLVMPVSPMTTQS